MLCPCQSGLAYHACCKPLIKRQKHPDSPLELMRSRYSAFVIGDADYLIYSDMHSTQAEKAEILAFAKGVEWIGLEIRKSYDDTVEFQAYYKLNGTLQVLHECSRFVVHNGRWHYAEGRLINGKIERNAPCPCKSGKKIKKCCGR